MYTFQEYLELREVGDYLSIGHNFKGNFDSWIMKRNANNIITASERGEDPEFFHDDYVRGLDFKGRIDHDRKSISVVREWGDQERLQYLVSILVARYPGYKIWEFGMGSPKQLS